VPLPSKPAFFDELEDRLLQLRVVGERILLQQPVFQRDKTLSHMALLWQPETLSGPSSDGHVEKRDHSND
jgi:hypothetical protein